MTVRNWRYFKKDEDIGLLKITNGQFMTGNILGIIADRVEIQKEQGNLLNAKSYDFPVRIKFVETFTGDNYELVARDICEKMALLEQEGCRFIVTTGGHFGLFNQIMHNGNMMVLSSPLSILNFVLVSIPTTARVCIVNRLSVDENCAVLDVMGFSHEIKEKCIFMDLKQNRTCDCSGKVIQNTETIGAYIWDDREDYHVFLPERNVPIYSTLKIVRFLKNVMTQIPYEGVI